MAFLLYFSTDSNTKFISWYSNSPRQQGDPNIMETRIENVEILCVEEMVQLDEFAQSF